MKKFLLAAYFLIFLCYGIFSYVLTDPNLTLLKLPIYLKFQNYLWTNILPQQNLRTIIYGFIVLFLFLNYFFLIKNNFLIDKISAKKYWLTTILIFGILLLSYNALSYDIFNYLFNAKMVIFYHANPHVQVALNFANDNWLRFMNNTHTPAPYGYGWTALSLPIYLLGGGKFLSTYLSFKFFNLLLLVLSFFLLRKITQVEKVKNAGRKLALLFFNPLFLIEILGNGHNDLSMLLPALLAVYLLKEKTFSVKNLFFALLCWCFSISTKYASLVLLPFLLYCLLKNKIHWPIFTNPWRKLLENYFFDFVSLAFFLPLLIERSKQFLPWYLTWSLIWLPLIKNKTWRNTLLIFSFSSMWRYLPWLYYLPWMSFDLAVPDFLTEQKIITWSLPIFYLLYCALSKFLKPKHVK